MDVLSVHCHFGLVGNCGGWLQGHSFHNVYMPTLHLVSNTHLFASQCGSVHWTAALCCVYALLQVYVQGELLGGCDIMLEMMAAARY
jgi:hypothetical protein